MLANVCFNPIPASAQEVNQLVGEAVTTDITELRAPGERDIYDVDTSDWDFSEPGMNKNNIDNHYYEHTLPADLGDPQPEIIPGKMRSDRIDLPNGVTKEEADKAEVQEAHERGIYPPGEQPLTQLMAADNCRTYWPTSHLVCGAIREKYESMAVTWAGQNPISFLGLPRSGELTNPDGVGKRTQFDNGFIYWHPDTGAWSVTTHNSLVWQRNGWELGRLGYPTSDEIATGDGVGRKQFFQKGRIYGSLSGVVSIEGKILEKWIETGEEKGPLGYPATDEEGTPDGIGRFNRFALGMIYWHPQYGAHPIEGAIGAIWQLSGYETSKYGYPKGGVELDSDQNLSQEFSLNPLNLKDFFEDQSLIQVDGMTYSQSYYDFKTSVVPLNWISLPIQAQAKNSNSSNRDISTLKYPENSWVNLSDVTYFMSSPKRVLAGYEYNPNAERKDLHDYCTLVDSWYGEDPLIKTNENVLADFRGSCASHDICYGKFSAPSERGKYCNPIFHDQLLFVCNNALTNSRARYGCRVMAQGIYQGVVIGNTKDKIW